MTTAYKSLSQLGERERLAALEWMGKALVYGSDGFGQQAAAGTLEECRTSRSGGADH